ncbi:SHOCK 22 KDA PROTEIN putative-RELATED [Salix viminalis]|uniref:SHOCK 22 kDa PROTEIN putative-RELATED n=1 Tax=Salix viminalis TaxID=40686 RepID=A0A9Q0UIT7_SALVM|nr:SHOCK 22 KDA PROTEIN putative-RELATED [Salix viminalis]
MFMASSGAAGSFLGCPDQPHRSHSVGKWSTQLQRSESLPSPEYNDASSLTHTPKAKKLSRLPHVFDRVLQLPFHSDTEVLVQETPDSFHFVANSENITIPDDYQALVVEIFPGLTKIVVLKDTDSGDDNPSMDELEIDTWRCRLPATVRPEMVNARCIEGQLIVTVPKTLESGESCWWAKC